MMSSKAIDDFLQLLRTSPAGAVFNPWWRVDQENDISRNAPQIRRKQLRAYLCERLGKARLAVIGEALGYRGGHFTGIPMTSERILLGRNKNVGIGAKQFFSDIVACRTSKPEICRDGFSEPTATIVWSSLLKLGIKPTEFVLWNAFPWHSFDPDERLLSNRTPTRSERAAGVPVLETFLKLFPCDQVVALGRIAASQLKELGIDAHCVRHPASGGAKLFRKQIAEVVKKLG